MAPKPSSNDILDAFTSWMKRVCITWDDTLISFVRSPTSSQYSGLALAVYASTDIQEGTALCQIPKSACITVKTSTISDILEKESLKGGLGLVIAVLYEAALGTASTWAGYFASMPQREYVPVFWTEKELSFLQGTELENIVDQEREFVKEDFENEVLSLIKKYPSQFKNPSIKSYFSNFDNFLCAASLVASRAFGVDDEHGDGMVPLADVFNHKVSVVDLAPGYQVHGLLLSSDDDDDSNDSDDSSDSDDSDDSDGSDDSDDSGSGDNDSSSDDEADIHNTNNTNTQDNNKQHTKIMMQRSDKHSVYGITTANNLPLPLEIAIIDNDDDNDCLQIIAASDIKKDHEIHNTYGEHGNSELVKKYAFALRENPFTVVTLDKESIVEACSRLHNADEQEKAKQGGRKNEKEERRPKKRSKKGKESNSFDNLVEIVRNETELLDEDEEPFEIQCNGYIGPSLFVTLRMLCSGCDGKKPFTSIDEALKYNGKEMDPSSSVQVWKVLDENGKKLNEKERKEWSGDGDEKHEMVDGAMCKALIDAIDVRLKRYKEKSVKEVERRLSTSVKGKKSSDELTAAMAGLTLKMTEMEILDNMKIAINTKLKFLSSS